MLKLNEREASRDPKNQSVEENNPFGTKIQANMRPQFEIKH